jgi:error-prone DNA polymerase
MDSSRLFIFLRLISTLRYVGSRHVERDSPLSKARGKNFIPGGQPVPSCAGHELVMLAQIGALNSLGENIHRRDALWQTEHAGRPSGSRFKDISEEKKQWKSTPLFQMTTEGRLADDYRGTGVTVGPHTMSYHRLCVTQIGVTPASGLKGLPDGQQHGSPDSSSPANRQARPRSFFFLSIENGTGVSRAIIDPDPFEKQAGLI